MGLPFTTGVQILRTERESRSGQMPVRLQRAWQEHRRVLRRFSRSGMQSTDGHEAARAHDQHEWMLANYCDYFPALRHLLDRIIRRAMSRTQGSDRFYSVPFCRTRNCFLASFLVRE